MHEKLKCEGIPSDSEIEGKLPESERRGRKAYAVIECFQNIPCNPCVKACPKGAIQPMENINDTPVVDYDICDGCGICISLCPGLAIFVVDESDQNGGKEKAIVKIPHEFLPPETGDIVVGLDRHGADVAKAKVVRVVKTKSKTNVVWLEVPREKANQVRAIRTGK